MLEKGRLFLRKDSTKDLVYFNINHKRFLFGSSECCTLRIYIDGIFPKHCVLTIGDHGKAYLKPLHPLALTLVNGIKINRKICLEDNDVITIFVKEFQFAYPPNSSSSDVLIERLLAIPFSKQMKPAQQFKIFILGKNWRTFHPFRECKVPNIDYVTKKLICMIESTLFRKIPEYLLKFTHHEPVTISYENINAKKINFSCSDKPLMKCMNRYVEESSLSRKNLALKLYEFFSFIRGLLNRNEEYILDLLPMLECVWKYCIARASEDILFLPLKSFYLNKEEITAHKKNLQSRILSHSLKNLTPNSEIISKKKNNCIEQKQNQHSSRKISVSYKKRVSLAVKRYHLRKRKSIMMAKYVENGNEESLESTDKRQHTKEKCMEDNTEEQDVVTSLEEEKTTRTKRKCGYNKKEKEELQNKRELKIRKENIAELTDDFSGNQFDILNSREQKQTKEKQSSKNRGLKKESISYSGGEQSTPTKPTEAKATKRSYKRKKKEASTNEIALKDGMKTKFTYDTSKKQNNTLESSEPKSKKRNYKKKKEVPLQKFKSCKSTRKCDMQELPHCQRITRSMAKNRS